MEPKNSIEPGIEIPPEEIHRPVLRDEVLDLLQIEPNQDFIDGTLGLGGHAAAILERSAPEGRLLGIDRDRQALALAERRLAPFAKRVIYRHGTFDRSADLLRELGWTEVHGMILDLGVSSLQLDDARRGFSFLQDSALDMRMDLEEEVTARELLDDLPEKELEAIFRDYGEERFARRIARQIVRSRESAPLRTTRELCQRVSRAVPFSKSRIHPATRVFQALRIAVNRELDLLKKFLSREPDFIRVGGVLAVISFHSLEDRIVKQAFRSFKNFQILTKKPLQAGPQEIQANPRSRSAKLRAVRRMS
ncbi:MAG TPA: 16S rRNA (cytosine(1402)-N(4))-methyltransferase [Deltaproteobacteria bacterium]|nr:16S rRNA (cytosine(1402)-N(4))-methyltransferase [Deltaproteobacteria bacterium]